MKKEFKFILLASIFIAGLLSANMLGTKITVLFGVAVSVGIFAYPLTFMITDVISEVFGKERAKQVVWSALIAQILVLLLIYISIKLPAADRYALNNEYVQVFSSSLRMIVASLIAFVVSQTHDIWAFNFWKIKTKGRYLWFRNNASTFVSQAIDTLLFMFIAFYGISDKFTVLFILQLSFSYWIFKIIFAVLDTPFIYLLVRWLRKDNSKIL
ncbi:queuosine precursor transporter [Patescibacteria group bacterium]|nr:queuosine precursor transporter [Patescibacteria group bacterium]MBU1895898.1 queuosine precursor transporter [Patescibacteria group bacterium]